MKRLPTFHAVVGDICDVGAYRVAVAASRVLHVVTEVEVSHGVDGSCCYEGRRTDAQQQADSAEQARRQQLQ